MLKLEVGKEYHIVHSLKGSYHCKILYVGKIAVYAEITGIINIRTVEKKYKIEVGQEVRLTKRHCLFNKISKGETNGTNRR
ncbi:unnamed protein product [marine sediment metagenome]|uniref:Uncharacterized protein n=1 Tax=marine sediment metagenome TaxID=412755 RepID=X1C018_9ZZZZ